jgi:hypothetical protein
VQVGAGARKSIGVGTVVDVEESFALSDELIVGDIKMRNRTIDERRHANEIGEDLSVICTGIGVNLADHHQREKHGTYHDADADGATDEVKPGMR